MTELDHDAFEAVLAGAELRLTGRLVQASNATFFCDLSLPDGELVHCVYKPVRGERPLWDYPDGTLAQREVAAYLVSRNAGFDLVPPTVLVDGPAGPGMVQRWIEVDEKLPDLVDLVPARRVPEGWFDVVDGLDHRERPVKVVHADDPRLRRMALFDAVINNSDRKGAHILRAGDRIWGCDHGVSLSVEPKLRTVLWGWAGEPLTESERELLQRAADCADDLTGYITPEEVAAYELRCLEMLEEGSFPLPQYDWPAIPWPPL